MCPLHRRNMAGIRNHNLSWYKKKLWRIFTEYVKWRDGYICYTCGNPCSGSNAHGGHFIPKAAGGLALYFHEQNVHCQCAKCNLFLEGNHYLYGQKLGKRIVDKLYKLMGKNEKWDILDYEKRIKKYETKLKNLKQKNLSGAGSN